MSKTMDQNSSANMDGDPSAGQCADAIAACACLNLRRASRAITKLYDDALKPAGLRSTQFVLLVVIRVHEPVSLTKLSRELVADRTTLVRNLQLLKNAGLIEEAEDSGEPGRHLQLTKNGNTTMNNALPLWAAVQQRFVSELGQNRWAKMIKNLDRAIAVTQAD